MIDGVYTKGNEGCRLVAYDDATGMPLAAGDVPEGTCTIAYGDTGPDVIPGLIISQAEADARFDRRWPIAVNDAANILGVDAWDTLDIPRQKALADMAYNLGGPRVSKFVNMIAALRAADWQTAAAECLNSAYARQVPSRAAKNAAIFAGTAEP